MSQADYFPFENDFFCKQIFFFSVSPFPDQKDHQATPEALDNPEDLVPQANPEDKAHLDQPDHLANPEALASQEVPDNPAPMANPVTTVPTVLAHRAPAFSLAALESKHKSIEEGRNGKRRKDEFWNDKIDTIYNEIVHFLLLYFYSFWKKSKLIKWQA